MKFETEYKKTKAWKSKMKFEREYRKLRARHTGKTLFIAFARHMYEVKGLEFTRKAQGEANFWWNHNDQKLAHENKATVKALCLINFLNWENKR